MKRKQAEIIKSGQEMIKCVVCYEPYTQESARKPRILSSCGHTACSACCATLITSGAGQNRIICPTCRMVTSNLRDETSLQINYSVLSLVSAYNTSNSSDESLSNDGCVTRIDHAILKTNLCMNCDSIESAAATCGCFHCSSLFCAVCIDKHNSMKTLRSHDILDVVTFKLKMSTTCARHPHDAITSFCDDCGVFACDSGNIFHIGHNVLTVADMSRVQSDELRLVSKTLHDNIGLLQQKMALVVVAKENIHSVKKKVSQEFDALRDLLAQRQLSVMDELARQEHQILREESNGEEFLERYNVCKTSVDQHLTHASESQLCMYRQVLYIETYLN
jgi:zinc-RING finger domain